MRKVVKSTSLLAVVAVLKSGLSQMMRTPSLELS
jgi:hypothetical protein